MSESRDKRVYDMVGFVIVPDLAKRAEGESHPLSRCYPVGAVELPPLTQFEDYFVAPVQS